MAPSEPCTSALRMIAQLLGLAGLDLAVQVFQGRATRRVLGGAGLALLDHGAGGLLVWHDAQDVARGRHLGQAEKDRRRATARPL